MRTQPRKIDRQTILRELRDIGLLVLVGLLMAVIFGYTKSVKQFVFVGGFSAWIWVSLWKGNEYISEALSSNVNWLKHPVASFFKIFIATVVYTVGTVLLAVKIFEWLLNIDFGNFLPTLYSTIIVTIIITLFMHGRSFLLEWQQSVIDGEKLKRENVTARYESLKNQVNPHFLFNSLNALTNLVYENQDLAAKFIKQLSEVYRYVLDTRDRELVSESEEISFLNSYTFLQKIRFGANLDIQFNLNGAKTHFPPLVLQMLIENAIKHNEISADHPLQIRIFNQDDYVVVENTIRKRKILKEDSPGIGLNNIASRYEFLTDRKVDFVEENGKFIVRLPIIHNQA